MADVLDIVPLRTFVAIADCGGFGRAAAALHLSQPTVSQHVRVLERRLGHALVEKSGRVAKFTDAGERLLLEARRILEVHDDALDRLELVGGRPIVVGSTETTAQQVLPELLATLRDAYPHRTVQFQIDRSTQLTEAAARGAVDLAVVLGLTPDAPGVEVGTLPLAWHAAPGWQPPEPDAPWPLVAYVEPCGMRQRALERLHESGSRVLVTVESTSLEGVLAAARAGLGVAVLPSAGQAPDGLVVRHDLPALGTASVRLVGRRGVDPDVERHGAAALTRFFAEQVGGSAQPPIPLGASHTSS